MLIKVWGDKKKNKDVYLNLCDEGDFIRLAAICEDGTILPNHSLLMINNKTGAISRASAINERFGFDLDEQGRLKLVVDDNQRATKIREWASRVRNARNSLMTDGCKPHDEMIGKFLLDLILEMEA